MAPFYQQLLSDITNKSGDHGVLKDLFEKHLPQANQLYENPIPYHTPPGELLTLLRDITMALFVKLYLTPFATAGVEQFREDVAHFFDGTGLIVEARLWAIIPLLKLQDIDMSLEIQLAAKFTLVDDQDESLNVGGVSHKELGEWALKLFQTPRAAAALVPIMFAHDLKTKSAEAINKNPVDSVHFFRHSDKEFYGFSGIRKIFINVDAIQAVLDAAKQTFSAIWTPSAFTKVVQMTSAMIGFHLIVYLILREDEDNAIDCYLDLAGKFSFLRAVDPGIIALYEVFKVSFAYWGLVAQVEPDIDEVYKIFTSDENFDIRTQRTLLVGFLDVYKGLCKKNYRPVIR